MPISDEMRISLLLEGYRAQRFAPLEVMEQVLAAIANAPDRRVWISLLPRERVLEYATALAGRDMRSLPLYGVPFAVKDNIDLEGLPTTAGCPDFAYAPSQSAFVVSRLIAAGAIPIGKTNLDQFATGLVGTRSPYGAARNSFNPDYISGGSSSGSAVAVATGLVSFSLGTDTAGSGRVPAGFNNIVGLKPTCGALSTSGVVPACRSLDCVSVFALTADDAARVLSVAAGFDASDPYSRAVPPMSAFAPAPAPVSAPRRLKDAAIGTFKPVALQAVNSVTLARKHLNYSSKSPVPVSGPVPVSAPLSVSSARFRFGVPRSLEFFGDAEYSRLFAEAARRLESLGGQRVEVDFEPFAATARLLYEGPWVAERYCAVGDFIDQHPSSVHPVTRQIITAGRNASAVDAFRSQYRLMELRRATLAAWESMDVLLLPTAPTIYRIDEVEADPIRLNSNLGYYTNFVNLLDLCAVAVPAGFRPDGLPFGVTLVGPAGTDTSLLSLGDRFHRAQQLKLGTSPVEITHPAPVDSHMAATVVSPVAGAAPVDSQMTATTPSSLVAAAASSPVAGSDRIDVAVCGAHMEGLPLNHQLSSRQAVLLSRTRTAPVYRFYALPGGPPYRPGLVRAAAGGSSIEVEVWSLPAEHFGSFVNGIPAPLGIGKVELQNGDKVPGFICESYAVADATDITSLGSWRRYLAGHSHGG